MTQQFVSSKRLRAVLEMLRDSLKEGEVVRDFTCGDIARADKTNVIADLAEEVSGLPRLQIDLTVYGT